MSNSEERTQRKARLWAWTVSLLSAGLLFCVLYFCGMYRPFPPPPEYGMEVNLGYSDVGMGDRQEMNPMAEPIEPVEASEPDFEEETVLTQADEEAPALPKVTPKPKPQPTVKPVPNKPEAQEQVREEKREPELNPLALYPGKRKGTDNSSQGETSQPGDQGKPTGDVNAKGYEGNGGSGGISFSLNGRTLTSLVKPSYNSEEEGVVVVRIWVNPAGAVTRAQAGVKGTTTFDQKLWRTAENAAKQSRFAPKDSAPSEQVGTISYRFVRGA